jgi:hypothetical protein
MPKQQMVGRIALWIHLDGERVDAQKTLNDLGFSYIAPLNDLEGICVFPQGWTKKEIDQERTEIYDKNGQLRIVQIYRQFPTSSLDDDAWLEIVSDSVVV